VTYFRVHANKNTAKIAPTIYHLPATQFYLLTANPAMNKKFKTTFTVALFNLDPEVVFHTKDVTLNSSFGNLLMLKLLHLLHFFVFVIFFLFYCPLHFSIPSCMRMFIESSESIRQIRLFQFSK
jgi:hypothetical protein